VTVLTTTTRLTNKFTFNFRASTDRFTVSNLRFTYITVNAEFTLHTVNDDIQVKLTHTRDQSLTCFVVRFYAE
jgi:hypothetical protein